MITIKNRNAILFGLPLIAAVLFFALAWLLYWQSTNFEAAYMEEAENNVAQDARLVLAVINPMLKNGRMEEATKFCAAFDKDTLRITLITESGNVLADSTEDPAYMGNHLERKEIRAALEGKASTAIRYSETLGRWMIYHAVPIASQNGTVVLRTAVSTDKIRRTLDFFRLNLFLALLLGATLVLMLALYIAKRISKPLAILLHSVGEIAQGRLDTQIDIPTGGIVRELAIGISDMTDMLKQQIAARTAENNERTTLFDTMSEAVILVQADGTILNANHAASELFSYAKDKDGFNLSRCQMPELMVLAHETFNNGTPFDREITMLQNGLARYFYARGSLFGTPWRRILITMTELTSLKRLESFRSDFIANVSHEIKTPLTCIVGAVEALEDEASVAQRPRLMEMLKKQTKRLNNLVADILSLAALEKKQQEASPEMTPVALENVLENAVNLCTQHAIEKGIKLAIGTNAPSTINGDSSLLEQSLVNLIENAIKYSDAKNITVSLKREDGKIILDVRDDGIGIPEEHQRRIFERFYRVDKSRSRELGGTGLGLAIVKHIAQLHHGAARLESTPGKGCAFQLEFTAPPGAAPASSRRLN